MPTFTGWEYLIKCLWSSQHIYAHTVVLTGLSRFSILIATKSWVGPGNEASCPNNGIKSNSLSTSLCQTYLLGLSCFCLVRWFLFGLGRILRWATNTTGRPLNFFSNSRTKRTCTQKNTFNMHTILQGNVEDA